MAKQLLEVADGHGGIRTKLNSMMTETYSQYNTNVIDIASLGAKENDALFDNAAIIQSAVNAYETVIINGIYYCSGVIINNTNVILTGNSFLKPFTIGQEYMILVDAYGFHVAGKLRIDGGRILKYGIKLKRSQNSQLDDITVDKCIIYGVTYLDGNNCNVQFKSINLRENGTVYVKTVTQTAYHTEGYVSYATVTLDTPLAYITGIYACKIGAEFFRVEVINASSIKIFMKDLGVNGIATVSVLSGGGIDITNTANADEGNCTILASQLAANTIGIHSNALYGPILICPQLEGNDIAIYTSKLLLQATIIAPYFEANGFNICAYSYMRVTVIEPAGYNDMYTGCWTMQTAEYGIPGMTFTQNGRCYGNQQLQIPNDFGTGAVIDVEYGVPYILYPSFVTTSFTLNILERTNYNRKYASTDVLKVYVMFPDYMTTTTVNIIAASATIDVMDVEPYAVVMTKTTELTIIYNKNKQTYDVIKSA